MSEINIDLLRKDECEPLTTEQMNDIKSQFHPSNTANVNIVPYHIYDEDGEEQRVGEVRKTIDGVKKRKPVYEKVVNTNLPASEGGIIDSFTDVIEMLVDITGQIKHNSGASLSLSVNQFANINIASNGKDLIWSSSNYLSRPCNIVVRYTKTTDEWQPV